MPEAGGRVSGPPFGWYHGVPTDVVDVSAGFPVAGDVHTPEGDVVIEERPGGRAVVAVHVGPYDTIEDTYAVVMSWMQAALRWRPARTCGRSTSRRPRVTRRRGAPASSCQCAEGGPESVHRPFADRART